MACHECIEIYYDWDLQMTYSDAGTGANTDCSIWGNRNDDMGYGCFMVGDYYNQYYNQPTGYKYCIVDDRWDIIAQPVNWHKGWDDSSTGGNSDGSFWWPECPLGYGAIGGVATHQSNGEGYLDWNPQKNYYCISTGCLNYDYSDNLVWTDAGSGGSYDAHIYETAEGVIMPTYLNSWDHLPFYTLHEDCLDREYMFKKAAKPGFSPKKLIKDLFFI